MSFMILSFCNAPFEINNICSSGIGLQECLIQVDWRQSYNRVHSNEGHVQSVLQNKYPLNAHLYHKLYQAPTPKVSIDYIRIDTTHITYQWHSSFLLAFFPQVAPIGGHDSCIMNRSINKIKNLTTYNKFKMRHEIVVHQIQRTNNKMCLCFMNT